MFASDQSDVKLHCKWFKIEKGVNYEAYCFMQQ